MIRHELSEQYWESDVNRLLNCLNPWLVKHWQTALVAAKGEPLYQPVNETNSYHQIQFAHGYFNSALHELAHWCVAGHERRKQVDFGYWYEPDGRTEHQQQLFEQVEVKPQAIEWHFSNACGRPFQVSIDNLSGESTDPKPFQRAVTMKARDLHKGGLNERTLNIINMLCTEFGRNVEDFQFRLKE